MHDLHVKVRSHKTIGGRRQSDSELEAAKRNSKTLFTMLCLLSNHDSFTRIGLNASDIFRDGVVNYFWIC